MHLKINFKYEYSMVLFDNGYTIKIMIGITAAAVLMP